MILLIINFSDYKLPWYAGWTFKLAGFEPYIALSPFLLHSVILAMFASFIAPFGGFFASGFKRAFKIKVVLKTIIFLVFNF